MREPKLGKLELQIMETLWTRGQASIREIQEAFPERARPAYTTIQTTVYRLEGKKAVRRVRKLGNFHIFEAAVSRSAAQRKLIDDLLTLFGGRTQPVMAHLIESGKLTLADVKEAEKTLRRLGRKGQLSMIPEYLYPTWNAIGATLGNHLWQSTLFAIVAGLLTLTLRNNPARFRYWLWLAASAKFLIPFSLLVGVGSHLAWSHPSTSTTAGLYFAMEEVRRTLYAALDDFSGHFAASVLESDPPGSSPFLPQCGSADSRSSFVYGTHAGDGFPLP